jgi:Flp pilus assembly protein TadB
MRLIYIADRTQQGAITVPGSRVWVHILFAFLTAVCVAALGWGVSGARIAVTVIFGGLLVVFVVGWIVTARRPRRLETLATSRRTSVG